MVSHTHTHTHTHCNIHIQTEAIDYGRLATITERFTGSGLRELCRLGAMATVRDHLRGGAPDAPVCKGEGSYNEWQRVGIIGNVETDGLTREGVRPNIHDRNLHIVVYILTPFCTCLPAYLSRAFCSCLYTHSFIDLI